MTRRCASILRAAIALAVGGWALWLWWPTGALLLVALNYAGFGETGFQKSVQGKLSLGARWLLAPYLAGAWINSRAWTRGEPAAHAVVDDVWLGRLPTGTNWPQMAGLAVTTGIGFTVALYITGLSFDDVDLTSSAKLGVLIASALAGVALLRMDVNIFVQVGFVVLVGLACKNAILIVEFARDRQQEGAALRDAAVEAATVLAG